jgi:pimeloyl-ACP methyl ester carboxylesterase
VHGFKGQGLKTWLDFPQFPSDRDWWKSADLLFIQYDSTRENIAGVANRIRQLLPAYYPKPHSLTSNRPGTPNDSDYEELVLVGHSLGAVILRRVMTDTAERWKEAGAQAPRPPLLDAQLRLFSPASAGFQPAGPLGTLRAAAGLWSGVELILRRSSTYSDLLPGSVVLQAIQRRTESLALEPGMESLKAQILWANPDNVVITERYDSDHPDDSAHDHSHTSVCKPLVARYETPWNFVETGAK